MAHIKYFNDMGVEVPSVTTILKILNKPKLLKWANVMGFKGYKIENILDRASYIGTTVHSLVEMELMGVNKEIRIEEYFDTINTLFSEFKLWRMSHKLEPIFMEKSLTSEFYGGTVDFYGKIDGKLTILDFKTSRKFYKSMTLQLAGYTQLIEKDTGHRISQVGILLINEDKCREMFIPRDKLDSVIDIFNILCDLYSYLQDNSLMED